MPFNSRRSVSSTTNEYLLAPSQGSHSLADRIQIATRAFTSCEKEDVTKRSLREEKPQTDILLSVFISRAILAPSWFIGDDFYDAVARKRRKPWPVLVLEPSRSEGEFFNPLFNRASIRKYSDEYFRTGRFLTSEKRSWGMALERGGMANRANWA